MGNMGNISEWHTLLARLVRRVFLGVGFYFDDLPGAIAPLLARRQKSVAADDSVARSPQPPSEACAIEAPALAFVFGNFEQRLFKFFGETAGTGIFCEVLLQELDALVCFPKRFEQSDCRFSVWIILQDALSCLVRICAPQPDER